MPGRAPDGTGRSFWRACRNPDSVYRHYQSGSLLACNFNQLWCLALNLSHRGERVDYFAMLHDDIHAEDFWLDKLIDELEDKHLDVLGVVVPIKDMRGITSLALHRDGDNWLPLARLSMHDVYQLPETFTSDDVRAPLLLNTGCWVAKWNQEWCRTVHFEIRDRIVFNRAANRYQSQTEPEDWHFSRQLHEIGSGPTDGLPGLRIGATRKIRLRHVGDIEFTNEQPWGQPFDFESCDVSPVPNAFPREIAGWLHEEEARKLSELAADKTVLEIGSYCGLSTVCMARTAKHVTAVDYFDGRATPMPRNTRNEFDRNIKRHGVADKITVQSPDDEIEGVFDLVFIDGDHSYSAVRADIVKACGVLADDGLLVFHDYGKFTDPGIDRAVGELLEIGGQLVSVTNTLAVVKPPVLTPMEEFCNG